MYISKLKSTKQILIFVLAGYYFYGDGSAEMSNDPHSAHVVYIGDFTTHVNGECKKPLFYRGPY